MKPIIKWAGGKEKELSVLLPYMPLKIRNYIEPFLGGGAVLFGLDENRIENKYYGNDLSDELISVYDCVKETDKKFFKELEIINDNFIDLSYVAQKFLDKFIELCRICRTDPENNIWISSFVKIHEDDFALSGNINIYENRYLASINSMLARRIRKINLLISNGTLIDEMGYCDNFECILKAAFYSHIRALYNQYRKGDNTFNHSQATAMFYFIRENCYSSMFRYNGDGDFNVPYGGISYNKHNLSKRIAELRSSKMVNKLRRTELYNKDFEAFLKRVPQNKDDFIFVDPPYDSDFSEYAQNEFNHGDQERLADYLANTKAQVMVVIKYSDFIYNLYEERGFNIYTFLKKYAVNFQNRNIRDVQHLIITNYNMET